MARTTCESDPAGRPGQFTLAGLMRLATVAAIVCGCVRWSAVDREGLEMAVFWVLLFWPSLVAVARGCGFRLVATSRRVIFLSVILAAVAVIVGFSSFAVIIYCIAIVIAWPPQALVLWLIRLDVRDWERRAHE